MKKFKIKGMKCQSCVKAISDALTNAEIQGAIVTLNPPEIQIAPSYTLSDDDIQKVISKAGDYKVVHDNEFSEGTTKQEDSEDENLTPLFTILSYIIGGVLLRALISDNFSFHSLMNNFMGGFFVVFSLFKLLNLSGFATAYATYDIIASKSKTYSLSYPFIELLLGIAYFTGFEPFLTNLATLILMIIGSVGVLQALINKRSIQCACLGTTLKLPMTKVTLVEDLMMGVMAAIMIFH